SRAHSAGVRMRIADATSSRLRMAGRPVLKQCGSLHITYAGSERPLGHTAAMSESPSDFRIGRQDASGPRPSARHNRFRRNQMIYAINYDLKRPGQNYDKLYDAIKSCGEWWHYLGSTWLVDTPLSATAIWERLAPHVDKN